MLQKAAADGLTVMIPGAFERRTGPPVVRPAAVPAPITYDRSDAMGDRERLSYELEGGGAPSERSPGRGPGILAWLRHAVGR
jgi:hypothetical protein